jgi:regulator of sirC expression with transglutaminase-like and TPR domain
VELTRVAANMTLRLADMSEGVPWVVALTIVLSPVLLADDTAEQAVAPACVPQCASLRHFIGLEERLILSDMVRQLKDGTTGLGPVASLQVFNDMFFGTLGFSAEGDLMDAESLLPGMVLKRRRGYCVGLASVYLLLAKEVGLPVSPVAAPNHVFLRFDDGETRRNIELLHAGAAFDETWYTSRYRIPQSTIQAGIFLGPMGEREFIAHIYSNLGALTSRRGDLHNARILYDAALVLHPRLPMTYYNRGLDLVQQGDLSDALEDFRRALSLNPTDPWTVYAMGVAFCRQGRTRRAAREFRRAIAIDTNFQAAKEMLTTLSCVKDKSPRHR